MFNIVNKDLMMIFLLEECNFSCRHCIKGEEPMDPGYKLSFQQLKTCLSDCQKLEQVEWVHFSGGEPTLWKEGDLGIADLMIEMAKAGFDPGFTTNGSYFIDYDTCYSLFKRYVDNATKTLRLFISIDTFHNNFDVEKARSECLDNFLKCMSVLPSEKRDLVKLIVLVVISKEEASLLPVEMVEHYESLGVEFRFIPLSLMGKAWSFPHLCPDPRSDRPEDLGAYYPYHKKRVLKNLDDPPNLVLIGDDYNITQPTWQKVARLGHLTEEIIIMYGKEKEE